MSWRPTWNGLPARAPATGVRRRAITAASADTPTQAQSRSSAWHARHRTRHDHGCSGGCQQPGDELEQARGPRVRELLAVRRCALPGCSISAVLVPARLPASTSRSASPTIQASAAVTPSVSSARSSSPGEGLRQSHSAVSSGDHAIRMVKAILPAVERHALGGEQLDRPIVDGEQLFEGDGPLGCRRLV